MSLVRSPSVSFDCPRLKLSRDPVSNSALRLRYSLALDAPREGARGGGHPRGGASLNYSKNKYGQKWPCPTPAQEETPIPTKTQQDASGHSLWFLTSRLHLYDAGANLQHVSSGYMPESPATICAMYM